MSNNCLAQVSLELEMLPKATGEAAASPAMSAAYSPINSPKTSSRGETQSLLGGKVSGRGDARQLPGVKTSLLRTSQSDASHEGPSSARIGAWPPGTPV